MWVKRTASNMIEEETLFALTTCCIVPGMVDTIRTYGHDGSVGCSNNDTVEDVINSKEWTEFFNILKTPTAEKPKKCLKMCSGPVNSNPEESKTTL